MRFVAALINTQTINLSVKITASGEVGFSAYMPNKLICTVAATS
jgi:hypothetical protein